MTTDKVWTINDIKTAVRNSGSHWFDPDTMRFFRCRVLEGVYQGEGGVYFVTSERYNDESPRLYSVRRFTPDTAGIDTVGDFNSMTRAKAIRLAKESAGPGLTAAMEEYKPVSVEEQFLADMRSHGCTVTRDQARQLRTLATRHLRLMERYCNEGGVFDENGDPLPPLRRLRHHTESICKAIGCGVVFSGATVKLTFADGYTNDWGKEGYCVPTKG